jgi:Tol biopolymer transport system component
MASAPLELRSLAGTGPESAVVEGQLWSGMRVGILGGPVDASGSRWYRVQVGSLIGWVAAGSLDGVAWLASVQNGLIGFGAYAPADSGVEILGMSMDVGDARQLAVISNVQLLSMDPRPAVVPVISCGDGITPAWSATGEWLSVIVAPACSGVIFTVGADGTHLRRVGDAQRGSWSPDGRTLAFDEVLPFCGTWPCGDDLGPWEIFAVTLPDGIPRVLTHGEEGNAFANPQWSPDGTQIAMSRSLTASTGEIADEAVFTAPVGGGEQRRLTTGSVVGWLPDGTGLIVSRSQPDGTGADLFVVSADGATEEPWKAGEVTFSPDGRWLLSSDWRDGGPTATLVRNDGTQRITLPTGWNVHGWSADGQQLLFSTDLPFDGWQSLYALDLLSGQTREIHRFPPGELASFGGFVVQPVLVYDLN